MSNEMGAAVLEVAKYFPTAVISGKSRDKVKGFVQLSNVYYAGSHGMDIMVPPKPLKPCDSKNHTTASALDKMLILQGSDALFQPAKRFLPAIQEISILLEEIARNIEGAKVEDNRFCIFVRYWKVREEDYGILEEKVKSVVENFPKFHLTRGKTVLEIRPSIKWNKDKHIVML